MKKKLYANEKYVYQPPIRLFFLIQPYVSGSWVAA